MNLRRDAPHAARRRSRWVGGVATLLVALSAAAAVPPPTVEAFAARARLEDVTISPDGRYLAFIQTAHGHAGAVVLDRQTQERKIVIGEPEHFHFIWCRFATGTRLVCSLRGMILGSGAVYPVTRLVAVDADGRRQRVLLQNNEEVQGQYQDRVINWDPGKADTVLVEADEGLSASQVASGARVFGNVGTHGLPAVYELNVVSGRVSLRQHAREPIRHWITDGRGELRLGSGMLGTEVSYYARLHDSGDWHRLEHFEVFTRGTHFQPIAISNEDPNKAYAIAPQGNHQAVWLMDLTDRQPPQLVFSNPDVDVTDPIITQGGRLLAIHYEKEQPNIYCIAVRICSVLDGLKKFLPGKFSVVAESTRDEDTYVVRSISDREMTTYSLVDAKKGVLSKLGPANPDLDPETISPLQAITYPARDGTPIPGYLTVPAGADPHNLPLVVMPHGGPIARDLWRYFFLRSFLVSRGYAVLQMNFRGSSGYGADWFFAAHQDWGGLTYDDVVDGARWAVSQGIADPARMCIVGWSFGGYLALLGAQRNPDLFRCSVSIAGISDLNLLLEEGHYWMDAGVRARQVGTDPVKLKRDSPRLHAADFTVPVLLIHGDRDAQVPLEQSVVMDAALTRAGRPHRLVTVPWASHQFEAEPHRVQLLREIEAFLAANVGSAPTGK